MLLHRHVNRAAVCHDRISICEIAGDRISHQGMKLLSVNEFAIGERICCRLMNLLSVNDLQRRLRAEMSGHMPYECLFHPVYFQICRLLTMLAGVDFSFSSSCVCPWIATIYPHAYFFELELH